MDDVHVYVTNASDSGQSEDINAFIIAVISGSMTEAYIQRFGHFGPKGFLRDTDPSPLDPQGLEELEDDEDKPIEPDTWE